MPGQDGQAAGVLREDRREGRIPPCEPALSQELHLATGCTLRPNPFGYPDVVGRNGLFLVRAQVDGRWHYGFLDIERFVVEYARGRKDKATYPIELRAER
jgi:hypothetical protein